MRLTGCVWARVRGDWQLAILQGTQIRVGIATVRNALVACALRTGPGVRVPSTTCARGSARKHTYAGGHLGLVFFSPCCWRVRPSPFCCCYCLPNEQEATQLVYSTRKPPSSTPQGPTTIAYIGGQKFAPTLCAFGDTVNTVPALYPRSPSHNAPHLVRIFHPFCRCFT